MNLVFDTPSTVYSTSDVLAFFEDVAYIKREKSQKSKDQSALSMYRAEQLIVSMYRAEQGKSGVANPAFRSALLAIR